MQKKSTAKRKKNASFRAFAPKAFAFILCLSFLLTPAYDVQAEWVEWIADAGIGMEYGTNINRSSYDSDQREDFSVIPSISVGRYNQLSDSTRLRATLDIEGGVYKTYDLLNYGKAGINLSVRQKLGFGADAPWLKPHLSVSYADFSEDTRDSSIYEAGISLGKHLTDRLTGQIWYSYSTRNGKDGEVSFNMPTDVFDQKVHAYAIEASYVVTDRVLVTGGYALRTGDFDSSCTPTNFSWVLQKEDVLAATSDDAYTEDYCVYRLSGDMRSYSIDASYSLFAGHGSINAGYQLNQGKASELDYTGSAVRFSFIYNY